MAFTSSSKRPVGLIVARSAAEAGLFALAVAGASYAALRESDRAAAVAQGVAAAWLASTLGAGWMIWAREASARAFWWAFGGGFVLRLAVLAALAVYAQRSARVWTAGLLTAYAFGVLFILLIEYRHIRLR